MPGFGVAGLPGAPIRILRFAIDAALQAFQKERSLRFCYREFKCFAESPAPPACRRRKCT